MEPLMLWLAQLPAEIETYGLLAFFFVLGACLGSFANVVIYRMPRGESVVLPSSYCRACGTPIRWYHNVPIFAWLILRGQCAACGARFSFRYAFVELLMAALFAATFWVTGLNFDLAERLLFIFAAVTASVIDLDHMILPDKFTLSGIVIGLLGALINPNREFLDALLGVVVGGGCLWLVAYLYFVFRQRDGMGGGDIKLLAWIGAVLGVSSIPVVVLLSSFAGAVVGIALAIRSRGDLKVAIPFGPYLASAAIIYMLFDGASWARWYLSLHGLSD